MTLELSISQTSLQAVVKFLLCQIYLGFSRLIRSIFFPNFKCFHSFVFENQDIYPFLVTCLSMTFIIIIIINFHSSMNNSYVCVVELGVSSLHQKETSLEKPTKIKQQKVILALLIFTYPPLPPHKPSFLHLPY